MLIDLIAFLELAVYYSLMDVYRVFSLNMEHIPCLLTTE